MEIVRIVIRGEFSLVTVHVVRIVVSFDNK